jgi:hypothetical protein
MVFDVLDFLMMILDFLLTIVLMIALKDVLGSLLMMRNVLKAVMELCAEKDYGWLYLILC